MMACVLGLVTACRDDGEGGPDTAGTTVGDTETTVDTGDEQSGSSTSPSTDPDDSGSSTNADPTTDSDTVDSSTTDGPDPFDPEALDDEFDDGLDGWSVHNEDLATIAIENGKLVLEPTAWTVWLHESTATLVHKPVAGDFKVTAHVMARGLASPDAPPPAGYRFGGLMARAVGGDAENYVFIVLGTDDDPSVETKTTVDSVSTWQGPPWPGAEGEVRICRVGDRFELWVREAGGGWQLSNAFDRPDLPAEVEVGPIAYNNDATPDLRVSFEFVDFEPVTGLDDCMQ